MVEDFEGKDDVTNQIPPLGAIIPALHQLSQSLIIVNSVINIDRSSGSKNLMRREMHTYMDPRSRPDVNEQG